jgi:two-component system, NtrC family, response regulator HydG
METQIAQTTSTTGSKSETLTLDVTAMPTLQEVERQYLNLVLERVNGNKVKAAKILGVSVKTIYNKLDAYKAEEISGT